MRYDLWRKTSKVGRETDAGYREDLRGGKCN